MAITKDKKRDIIAKLKDAFNEASAIAFVGFTKLSVQDAGEMRKKLADEGVRFYVAKKTLIRKALEESAYEGELPDLPGEVAIAWTAEDETAPARSVYEASKKLKDSLALLGGVFNKAFKDKEAITAIATIPSMPVLRGMFVNVVNSPIQSFVIALDKIRETKAA